jgi:hypothetical protein
LTLQVSPAPREPELDGDLLAEFEPLASGVCASTHVHIRRHTTHTAAGGEAAPLERWFI